MIQLHHSFGLGAIGSRGLEPGRERVEALHIARAQFASQAKLSLASWPLQAACCPMSPPMFPAPMIPIRMRVQCPSAATPSSASFHTRHYTVLAVLAAGAGLSQRTIAETLGLDRATVVALVARVESQGLARRAQSRADRRANAVELTA